MRLAAFFGGGDIRFGHRGCRLHAGVERLPGTALRPPLLALGDRALRLHGAEVERLLDLLGAGRSVDELLDVVGAPQRDALLRLLGRLDALGFLRKEPAASAAAPRSFLAAARACRRELARLRSERDAARIGARIVVHGGGTLTALVARLLAVVDAAPDIEPRLRPTTRRSDAAVVVAEGSALGGLGDFDLECRALGRPWLLVRLTGPLLRLGPWFAPETPCFACYSRRCAAAAAVVEDFADLVAARSGVSAMACRADQDADLLLRAAELAALAVIRSTSRDGAGRFPPDHAFVEVDLTAGPDATGSSPPSARVLSTPECAACAPIPARVGVSVVDPAVGIVRSCRTVGRDATGPDVVRCIAEARRWRPGVPLPLGVERIFGVGVHLDERRARAAAVGEALERYGAAFYDRRKIVSASWEDLQRSGRRAVRPGDVAPFLAAQLERHARAPGRTVLQPFDDSTRAGWVPAVDLGSGAEVLVPAALVYFPYAHPPNEPRWSEGTSTGLAVAADWDAAALHGLLEVVERDAASLAWLTRPSWPRLGLASLARLEALWSHRLQVSGVRLHLADLSCDTGVPVIAAAIESARGGVSLGTAARFDVEEAAIKATLEACQAWLSWKGALGGDPGRELAADFVDVVEFSDHALLATRPDYARCVIERFAEPGTARVGEHAGLDAAVPLRELAERVGRAGFAPLAVDLTPVDLRAAGYCLVRVVVPGLVPLNGDHLLTPVGLRRCRERGGWPLGAQGAGQAHFERRPHPFP